jgi:hypothetical protein
MSCEYKITNIFSMKGKLFFYFALITVISGYATINPASGKELPNNRPPEFTNSGLERKKATVNQFITEIADLEVQSVLLASRYTLDSKEIKAVNQKLQKLRQQLVTLEPNSISAMNAAISKAIKAKISELEVEQAIKRVAYDKHSPIIQVLDEDIKGLRQRFAQLQPRNSQRIINRVVSQSIKSKISELKIEEARLKKVYSRDSVELVTIKEQIINLEQRLAMLR